MPVAATVKTTGLPASTVLPVGWVVIAGVVATVTVAALLLTKEERFAVLPLKAVAGEFVIVARWWFEKLYCFPKRVSDETDERDGVKSKARALGAIFQ